MRKKSRTKIVLDAWALMALIFKEEPAATRVKQILEKEDPAIGSVNVSWINVGEVYYSIAQRKGLDAANEVFSDIRNLPVTIHQPSKNDILAAAVLRAAHKLSYADAFAVSLTQRLNAIIVTGDPEIISLNNVVTVERLARNS
jgi:predicted nucleic acid-binding protein